jgi:hypothetical protein
VTADGLSVTGCAKDFSLLGMAGKERLEAVGETVVSRVAGGARA